MASERFDVILVGGGVMGCAIAYYLKRLDDRIAVAIVEKDPTYARSSTVLSDGNARVQFNLKENIQISLYGLEALARFGEEMAVDDTQPDVAFRRQGNLFLVDENGKHEAEEALALQQSLGCQVEWWTPAEIEANYPLYRSVACAGGTFGRLDGTMDPWAVLQGYRNKAIDLGARYIPAEVEGLVTQGEQIGGVRLASGQLLAAPKVVNSAGAWAASLARTAGIWLPVEPVKRQVFIFEAEVRPEKTLPTTIFPSGLYLIHEHQGTFMCGKSLPDDPVGFEFGWQSRIFEERLWPELVSYVPAFDRLKLVRGWAGLYAVNTLDGNAILGEWPELTGFYLVNGFSGHGFQQCHAVGRYLAELMLGWPLSLDLSIFSPQRILDNRPVFEGQQRLI